VEEASLPLASCKDAASTFTIPSLGTNCVGFSDIFPTLGPACPAVALAKGEGILSRRIRQLAGAIATATQRADHRETGFAIAKQ